MNKASDFFWVLWAFFCGKVLRKKEFIIQKDGDQELPTTNINRINMLMGWWNLEPTWSGGYRNSTIPSNWKNCNDGSPTLQLQLVFRQKTT